MKPETESLTYKQIKVAQLLETNNNENKHETSVIKACPPR